MTTKPTELLIVLVLLLAGCAGCAGLGSGAGEGAEPPDGDWVLADGTGPDGPIELVDGHVPTLTVDGEEWGGSVCNHYGATVRVAAGNQVRVGEVVRTEMACLAEGAMASEDAYLTAFTATTSYERDDARLVLRGPDVELVYDEHAPGADAEPEGSA
jgi:heat shock protein HslJ